MLTLLNSRHRANAKQPMQMCSSCNNEVVASWRKCIYCGETLIPSDRTHDGPKSGLRHEKKYNKATRAVMLPWTHKR